LRIIARVSNRIFVGLPLCRNKEYLQHAVGHAVNVIKAATVLRFLPEFLKPIVILLFRDLHRGQKVAHRYIAPIIEDRQKMMDTEGYKKPTDFLQWLMDSAQGIETRSDCLASRVLLINFASIHTTTISFTHVIYDLAIHPEYVTPLREEIEALIAKEGWTKSTVTKMRKLDSFLKESIRMHPLDQISLGRKTMRSYTFADGVIIPKGIVIAAPPLEIHMDEKIYENPLDFDGFRFSRMGEGDRLESAKYFASNTAPEYLHFGHGQHACPGRFFAVNELKVMLAFILLRYDVKTKDGTRPLDIRFQSRIIPNMSTQILFRRRQ